MKHISDAAWQELWLEAINNQRCPRCGEPQQLIERVEIAPGVTRSVWTCGCTGKEEGDENPSR